MRFQFALENNPAPATGAQKNRSTRAEPARLRKEQDEFENLNA
jgi:hypothetical protein